MCCRSAPPERPLRALLWIAAVGFFMQTLDSTIVNTALPAMARSLGESPLRMQSVVVSYALTMAMLIPASGWLADRFGTRLVYLAAIVLFVLGSICCASSQNLTQLVMSRVLQGMGGAMLMPVGRLAVLRAFPRERFLRAMSFVTIPGLIGPLLGPTFGGWLVEIASWQWIFLINIPVGIVGCIATMQFMPDSREPVQRFDLAGYGLLAFGMASISLALDGLAGLGMTTAVVRVLLLFGLANIAAYWLHAAHHPMPLFAPALFQVRAFAIGLLGNLFARIGAGAMPFLLPLLMQVVLGYSPLHAGMMMIPVAAASMAAKPLAPRLIQRIGYRRMLTANTLLLGLTIASFALLRQTHPLWLQILQLATLGVVNSLQFTAMNTVTLKDLTPWQASGGNSLLSMVMMLAMSLGVATAGALLANFEEQLAHNAGQILHAFQATFCSVGAVTIASAWIFWQLASNEQSPKKSIENPELNG